MHHNTKIGILGGGQLGKMACLAAANWDLKTYVLDPNPACSAAHLCTGFTCGDFNDYDTVWAFGQDKDLLTIEIEHVNTAALKALQAAGKVVHPDPAILEIIQDKGTQKEFYRTQGLPTADFELFADEHGLLEAVQAGRWRLPFVQKTRKGGYDGKGVALLRTTADLEVKLLKGPCLAEQYIDVATELAVLAARRPSGEVAVFPPVEMAFHPEANLVEYLYCPSQQPALVLAEAEALAERVIRTFDVCGLLAVELLLTKNGDLLLNEVAPRPHNSGHHTLDSAATSQFQQYWRAILDWPLGDTTQQRPAVMVNLLGEPDQRGLVHYQSLPECMGLEGVHVHLYGKTHTAPYRKMGHLTVTAETLAQAIVQAKRAQMLLRCVAQ